MKLKAVFLCALCTTLIGCTSQDWVPPKTVVAQELLDATQFLLAHGMDDPRGGEYRSATIFVRDDWRAEQQKVEIHGWVKPSGMVVWWDGLAYRAESIGQPADLATDIEARSEQSKAIVARYGATARTQPALRVPLLLILGELKLAEKLYAEKKESRKGEEFLPVAQANLLARFHRAVHAHMAGDDKQALEDATILYAHAAAFEAEAERLLGREQIDRRFESTLQTGNRVLAFRFLSPVSRLIEDSARRLAEEQVDPDPKTLAGLRSWQRITKLIDWLDEVKARQFGQPGGVNIIDDPICRALVQEGEAAVEPLIDVIESDKRLTRSVSFGRDFFPDRNLISVASAAYGILGNILQIPLIGKDGYRPYSVDELRAFWNKSKGKTRAERLFDMLANDDANSHQWLEAATRLVQSVDIRQEGVWISVPTSKIGVQQRMVGEELRARTNPSVTELLSKRALQIAGSGEIYSSKDQFDGSDALRIGIALAKWDLQKALSTLRQLTNRGAYLAVHPSLRGNAAESIYAPAGHVFYWRIRGGDPVAWSDYETMVREFEPNSFVPTEFFLPLWQFDKSKRSNEIARLTFLEESSKFMAAMRQLAGLGHLMMLVNTPLLKVAAFRELLIRLLADNKIIGSAVKQNNMMRYELKDGGSGSRSLNDDAAKTGETGEYRLADAVALEIAQLKGAPTYSPFWKGPKRTEGLNKIRQYLGSIKDRVDSVLSDHVKFRYRL